MEVSQVQELQPAGFGFQGAIASKEKSLQTYRCYSWKGTDTLYLNMAVVPNEALRELFWSK